MTTHTHTYVDPDGIEFLVEFEVDSYGSAPHMGSLTYPGDPGDPAEFHITEIESRGSRYLPPFEGLDELLERIEVDIHEKVNFEDYARFDGDDDLF